MLLLVGFAVAFLRPGGIVLLDEPDLHIHMAMVTQLLETLERVAKRMGITSNLTPSYCPLTLGASPHGINPLEMASGYATLANGGVHCQPYSIARIVGPDGKMLFRQKISRR